MHENDDEHFFDDEETIDEFIKKHLDDDPKPAKQLPEDFDSYSGDGSESSSVS